MARWGVLTIVLTCVSVSGARLRAQTDVTEVVGRLPPERLWHELADDWRFAALYRVQDDQPPGELPPLKHELAQAARQAKSTYRPIDAARLSLARGRVVQAVDRLGAFLRTAPDKRRRAWEEFLRWDQLRRELDFPGLPSLRRLVGAYERFNSGQPGLERRQFSEVRRTLLSYLECLRMHETRPERLPEARRALEGALSDLDRYLASGGRAKEQGWKKYLRWEELERQLGGEAPDPRVLTRVLQRYESGATGLERIPFRRVAADLDKYSELLLLRRGPQARAAQERYEGVLEQLAQALEAHAERPTNATAAQVNQHLRWLRAVDTAPELRERVERAYAHPNLYTQISADVVARTMRDRVCSADPIAMWFCGSWVTGTAHSTVDLQGQVVPSDDAAVIDLLFAGTSYSRAVGRQRSVNVFTSAVTSLWARKRLLFTENGVLGQPVETRASTQQCIRNVRVDRRCGRRLISRFALRRACELQPLAECVADTQARGRMTRRIEAQAGEMLRRANRQIASLRRRGVYPSAIRIRSTSELIDFNALVTGVGYLGAPGVPPDLPSSADAVVRVHQSWIGNATGPLVAGITFDNEGVVRILEENNLPVPEELRPRKAADGGREEPEQWSMTFDRDLPVSVTFTGSQARVAIRGTRFTRDEQTIDDTIEISAVYDLTVSPAGHLEGHRVGEILVDFVNIPGRLGSRQIAYKTFLKRKMDALFRTEITADDVPQEDLREALKAITVAQLKSDRGWLALALNVDTHTLRRLRRASG